MQVYTNRDHVANAHRKDSTLWAVRCQAVGRVKKNVEPLSGSDSIQIRPPWRSTIFRQIASPIPVPEYSSRVCNRRNGSKIRSAKREHLAGSPWGAELIRRYMLARDDYIASFGVRMR